MHNIGLMGHARSGKDTAGRWLVEHHGHQRVGFADPLKEMALRVDPIIDPIVGSTLSDVIRMVGWEDAKDDEAYAWEVRRFLQNLGSAVRDLDPGFWISQAFETMADNGWDREQHFVITDVRYPNEVQALRTAGFKLLYIDRPGVSPVNDHASETSVGPEDADVVVPNTGGLESFYVTLSDVVESLSG